MHTARAEPQASSCCVREYLLLCLLTVRDASHRKWPSATAAQNDPAVAASASAVAGVGHYHSAWNISCIAMLHGAPAHAEKWLCQPIPMLCCAAQLLLRMVTPATTRLHCAALHCDGVITCSKYMQCPFELACMQN